MDIHPILVHFPIALLSTYAFLEIVTVKRISESLSYLKIKFAMLFFGVLGSFASLASGEGAEHRIARDASMRHLVDVHSTFASASTFVFSVLGIAYLIIVFSKTSYSAQITGTKYENIYKKLLTASFFVQKKLGKLFAIIGLILITITGGLGGAIAYGKDIDPIVSLIYRIIIGQ